MSDHDPSVVACSALKPAYRDRLRPATFVYLKIGRELAQERLAGRFGHFFKADLLDSQFAALEEPGSEETDVLTVDADASVEDLVQFIIDNVSGLAPRQRPAPEPVARSCGPGGADVRAPAIRCPAATVVPCLGRVCTSPADSSSR